MASCQDEPDYKLIIRVKGKVVPSAADLPRFCDYQYGFSSQYYKCAESLDPSHSLAFAMATHTRLGELSGLNDMSDDVLCKILELRRGMEGPIISAKTWEEVKQLVGCAGRWGILHDDHILELMDIARAISRQRAVELGADRTPRPEDEEALLEVYVDVMKMAKNLGAFLPEDEHVLAVEVADLLVARQQFEPAAKHLGDLLSTCGLEAVDDYYPTWVRIQV